MSALRLKLDDGVAALRSRLRQLTRSFDARPQRERMAMILAAGAVALWAADKLWLTPAFERSKTASVALSGANAELATLRADISRLQTQGAEEDRQLRAQIEQLRHQVDGEATALRAYENTLVGADHMVELLEQMLPRGGRLKVREMKSLGRTDLLASAPPPSTQGPVPHPAPAANGSGALYRHGVELTLEGSWPDLVAYLQSLEQSPKHVLWGGLSMKVEQYPKVVLTLRLYTLSLDRGWLEI